MNPGHDERVAFSESANNAHLGGRLRNSNFPDFWRLWVQSVQEPAWSRNAFDVTADHPFFHGRGHIAAKLHHADRPPGVEIPIRRSGHVKPSFGALSASNGLNLAQLACEYQSRYIVRN
jgi:hypothetical protein